MKTILLGGGLDSTALLIYLRMKYPKDRLSAIHIDYGQKAVKGELASCEYFCKKYNVKLLKFKINLKGLIHSPLIDKKATKDHQANVIPFRNLLFITVAMMSKAKNIYLGFHIEPPESTFYDATSEFVEKINELNKILHEKTKIITPFAFLKRQEIMKFGVLLDNKFITKTFTCYESRTTKECQKCTHCQQKHKMLDKLLKEAGIEKSV